MLPLHQIRLPEAYDTEDFLATNQGDWPTNELRLHYAFSFHRIEFLLGHVNHSLISIDTTVGAPRFLLEAVEQKQCCYPKEGHVIII